MGSPGLHQSCQDEFWGRLGGEVVVGGVEEKVGVVWVCVV